MKTGRMRWLSAVLCGGLFLAVYPGVESADGQAAQAASGNPTQQLEAEPQPKETRQSLQARGKEILAEELAPEKAGDCAEPNTTYDFNLCFDKQLTITERNLSLFEGVIRDLQAESPESPESPADTASYAMEFDRVEQSWRAYRDVACKAAFHQFGGGTGAASFEMECRLKLARDHMRELDMIYGEDLHL